MLDDVLRSMVQGTYAVPWGSVGAVKGGHFERESIFKWKKFFLAFLFGGGQCVWSQKSLDMGRFFEGDIP